MADVAAGSATPERQPPDRDQRALFGSSAVLLCVLVALSLTHISAFDGLSPVDELPHFDNLVRTSTPDLTPDPRAQLSNETLRELQCRAGHDDLWRVAAPGDPCLDQRPDPAEYTWRGLNSSIGHVPAYYLVTGIAARALRTVAPGPGLFVWSRLLGVVWTFAGCLLVLVACRMIRMSPWAVVPATAMLLAVPSQLEAETTVNPDASLFFIGALLLYVVLALESGRLPWGAVVPVSAFAALLDPSALVGVVLAAVFLALRAVHRRDELIGRKLFAAAVVAVVTAAVTTVAWSILFQTMTTPATELATNPQDDAYHIDALSPAHVLGRSAVLGLLPPVHQPHSPEPLRSEAVLTFVGLIVVVLLGALVGPILKGPYRHVMVSLAAAVAIALVVSAPLMVVRNYVVSRWYFEIPSRYGLTALPALALLVAHVSRSRPGRVLVAALAAGFVGTVVEAMA